MRRITAGLRAMLLMFTALFSFSGIPAAVSETNAASDPACAEIRSVTAETNRNITGTYRKYDDGDTPVILFFDGSCGLSRDAALFRYEELVSYNLYCFNTTSPDGVSFNIANYRTAGDLQHQYGDAVIREVLRTFPAATKIGVVSYSNGGYAANAVCRAAAGKGLTVCWAAGYDNIVREEKRYLTYPDYIRENDVPCMLAVSTDRHRAITRNSAAELTAHGSDYAITKTYDAKHNELLSADGVSRDLADFAVRYFGNGAEGENKEKTVTEGGRD